LRVDGETVSQFHGAPFAKTVLDFQGDPQGPWGLPQGAGHQVEVGGIVPINRDTDKQSAGKLLPRQFQIKYAADNQAKRPLM
jgi:hypothetical protein